MINTKKRAADTNKNGEEQVKKKISKFVKSDDQNSDSKQKFAKGSKPTSAKNRDLKNRGKNDKVQWKNNSNFSGKHGSKLPHRVGNKFRGKPKFGVKKANESDHQGEAEKTDWRKFKQDKKDLKLKRKQSKNTYEISIEAKQIYEKLKCRKTDKKGELVEKLYNLLKDGDILKKVVMAHDTGRIIQCMLKFASPTFREQLSELLIPYAVEMSVSKYAHFCILRMFKYGAPVTKSKLVDSFTGNIVRLACHNISSKILDHVYLTVANVKQKAYMRQEFYGDLYKNSKDDNVKSLADSYKETSNMKASILSSVKANLEHVVNKQLVDNSLVHAIMLEYVKEMEDDKVEETVTMFASVIPLMLTTKEGCQAAIICFHKSIPKNRRAIIKNIKEHLVKICTHEHGHIFAIAVLNALDDTKATKKAIYDTIHPELETIMGNQWGRRVVEWFVSPGDTNCFHPTFIATIEGGLQYGKKDKDVRRKEIFEQIEEPIATTIAANPEFWLSDKHIALVTAEILKKLTSKNFVIAASSLAKIISKSDWSLTVEEVATDKKSKKPQDVEKIIAEATKLKTKQRKMAKKIIVDEADVENDSDEEQTEEISSKTVLGIEEAGLHIVLKKIIKNDKERLVQDNSCDTFGKLLLQEMSEDTITSWLNINRACFVLLNILENNSDDVKEQLKTLLKSYTQLLKTQKFNGAQLLQNKLI